MDVTISEEWAAVARRLAAANGFANPLDYIEQLIMQKLIQPELDRVVIEESLSENKAGGMPILLSDSVLAEVCHQAAVAESGSASKHIEWLLEMADYDDETQEETIALLRESIEDHKAGRFCTLDEAFARLMRKIDSQTKQPA